jgi:hypothetical protein
LRSAYKHVSKGLLGAYHVLLDSGEVVTVSWVVDGSVLVRVDVRVLEIASVEELVHRLDEVKELVVPGETGVVVVVPVSGKVLEVSNEDEVELFVQYIPLVVSVVREVPLDAVVVVTGEVSEVAWEVVRELERNVDSVKVMKDVEVRVSVVSEVATELDEQLVYDVTVEVHGKVTMVSGGHQVG